MAKSVKIRGNAQKQQDTRPKRGDAEAVALRIAYRLYRDGQDPVRAVREAVDGGRPIPPEPTPQEAAKEIAAVAKTLIAAVRNPPKR
jgi:hypothetical protein